MSEWNNRNNPSHCPCKDCETRSVGCHGGCGRYAEWKKKLDETNRAKRDYMKSRNTMSDAAIQKMWREKRRNKKKLKPDYN